jgi:EAL domain-containing protein (putative c-di-GMP-specific phosphodiesterase class I)
MFAFFTADMHTQSLARLDLEHDLRKAEARGEFILHYQPQIDLRSGAIVGVEALIRWQHPTRGLIPPGQFIPIAEETGLITAIASWTLRTACRQARQWRAAGLSPVRIAVNLSARQFHQVDLVADIASVLAETQIEARWLDIELTESVVMSDAQATIAMLHDLKNLGVQLSVDDFGTGYSSLSYLRRFPIDTLKIDRSFVSDIPSDADDAAIVAAIIVLAHSLKLTVIAEGVETEEQEAFLRRHGCDEVQGFLHSRPVPGEQIAAMLSRGGSWVKSAGEVSRH